MRLDPNLPISSQFHDYFYNPLGAETAFNNRNRNTGAVRSSTGRSSGRSRKQTPILISPGKYATSESLSEGESSFTGLSDHSANTASSEAFGSRQRADRPPSTSSSIAGRSSGKGSKSLDPESSQRHRELHKNLEKNRRAHLRHCFEELRKELPKSEYSYKKSSHINIIHSAIRYITCLKKTEFEYEREIDRLARCKIKNQNYLDRIRKQFPKSEMDSLSAASLDSALHMGSTSGSNGDSSSNSSSPPVMDESSDRQRFSSSAAFTLWPVSTVGESQLN